MIFRIKKWRKRENVVVAYSTSISRNVRLLCATQHISSIFVRVCDPKLNENIHTVMRNRNSALRKLSFLVCVALQRISR